MFPENSNPMDTIKICLKIIVKNCIDLGGLAILPSFRSKIITNGQINFNLSNSRTPRVLGKL